MSVLSHQSIKRRAAFGVPNPLIEPFEEGNCRSAGYDLRAGGTYYLAHTCDPAGQVEFGELSRQSGPLEIGRNRVALISVQELLFMPNDLVGHITLKMDLLLSGIIMGSQSQIDAGYEGNLIILLYNLSERSVFINWNESIVRVEFALLDEDTERPYDEGNTYQKLDLRQALKEPIDSSLRDMERRIDVAEEDIEERIKAAEEKVETGLTDMERRVGAAERDLEKRVNAVEENAERTSRRDIIGLVGVAGGGFLSILTVILVVVGLLGPTDQEASNAQAAASGGSHLMSELNQAKMDQAHLKQAYEDAAAQLTSELTQAKAVEAQLQHELAGASGVTGATAQRLHQEIQLLATSIRSNEGVLDLKSQHPSTVIRR